MTTNTVEIKHDFLRAIVSRLHPNAIEATKRDGTIIFIPRITLIPSDATNNIVFRRKQFPIRRCYSMTINRSQGQDFTRVGVDLTSECFTHGQLCVSLSRARDPENIVVLSQRGNTTRNPVYLDCVT